jgi:hypothetical protein
MCLVNSPAANYKVSMSERRKQTHTHTEKTKDETRQLVIKTNYMELRP